MAQVTGLVQQVKYNPSLNAAFIWLGPSSDNTTVFFVQTLNSDDDAETAIKSSMIDGLSAAMLSNRSVTLTTDDGNPPSILTATLNPS